MTSKVQESVSQRPPPCNDGTIYRNKGNLDLLKLIPGTAARFLDVGCGAGDNARLLRRRIPSARIDCITASGAEAQEVRQHADEVWVWNLEDGLPPDIPRGVYDVILLSHVLEHLRCPWDLLDDLSNVAEPANGIALVALPNIGFWRTRLALAFNGFRYSDSGMFDRTHLRFFSWPSVELDLIGRQASWLVTAKSATGLAPMFWLRRVKVLESLCARLDRFAGKVAPGLFGWQMILCLGHLRGLRK